MRVKLGEIIHSNYWNQPFWNELNITFETSEIRLFEWVKSDFWNEWNMFVKMSEMHFWMSGIWFFEMSETCLLKWMKSLIEK